MAETVDCSECGTRYDSQVHPFCPRCGSTARAKAVPGAVASAARRDPGRRRVQASGGVLLAVGLLFLASAAASLAVPAEEAAAPLVDAMADQPGGALVLAFPAAGNGTARLSSPDGKPLANASLQDGSELRIDLPRAAVVVVAEQDGVTWNQTVLVLRGDELTVQLPPGGGNGTLQLSPALESAAKAARYVLLAMAVLLVAGGASALALRAFALAAAGAGMGLFLGLLAIVGFLAVGLLFAIPFGLCAYFILRGRRHFRQRRATA